MKYILMVTLVLGALINGACVPMPPPTATPPPDMTNPASKYCADQGGTLEIRKGAAGETGYCKFADGSECEEWAFFQGQCSPTGAKAEIGLPNPASKFCADQGGKLEIRDEAGGQVGYCLFPGGGECEEWAFMRGECKPATP